MLAACCLLPALLWWARGGALHGFYLADDFMFLRAGAHGGNLPLLDSIWLCLWPEPLLEGSPKQYWRPLHNLLLLFQQLLFGLDPLPRHGLQLVMFGIGAIGVALWTRALGARTSTATLAATLYLAHPLHGELAYWLAAQDILVAISGILLAQGALATAARRSRRGRACRRWYLLACAAQTAAVMGHELGIAGIPLWWINLWALRPGHRLVFRWLLLWASAPVLIGLGWAAARAGLFGWSQVFDFWNEEAGVAGSFRPDRSLWYRLGAVRAAVLPVHWGIPGALRAIPAALLLLVAALQGCRYVRHPGRQPAATCLAALAVVGIALVGYVPPNPDLLYEARTTALFAAAISMLAAVGIRRSAQRIRNRPLRAVTWLSAAAVLLLASIWASHHNDGGYAKAQAASRGYHTGVRQALGTLPKDGHVYVADIPRILHGALFRLAPFGKDSIEFGPPLLPQQQGPRLRRFRPGKTQEWFAAARNANPKRDQVLRFHPVQGVVPAGQGALGIPVPGGRLQATLGDVSRSVGDREPVELHVAFTPSAPHEATLQGHFQLMHSQGSWSPEPKVIPLPKDPGALQPALGAWRLPRDTPPGELILNFFGASGGPPVELGRLTLNP